MNLTNAQLIDIADNFGSPVYVYDADAICNQYAKLVTAFNSEQIKFFYACKALSNINILKLINQQGAGLDCVSINEVRLGLQAGFTPERIIFTPNCVDFSEVEAAKAIGLQINIDNISLLEQFGNKFNGSYPVGIRINPHIMAGGNVKISTGHVDSKFGISVHQLRHIERVVRTTGLKINGLHMHTGSDIQDVNIFIQSLEILLETAKHFPDIKFIDLGSGFKVAYTENDYETNLDELASKVKDTYAKYAAQMRPDLEIWFEPGKFLVSGAGYLVVTANVIKQTTATTFVGVNSGFNHLIRPMFYNAYHRINNISSPEGVERIYTVVGNLCETDTFAVDRKINEVHEGDYLVIRNAGAYGFEMSSNFNSRLKPAEVLVYKHTPILIRRRDEYADLLRNQIECSLDY